jgi:ABC-type Mn2+/Zn2+ transport system permease subunit
VIDALLEPFQSGIGQRMLAELVLLGVVCGPLGVWVLLMRHAYAAESLSHAMLPGLVLATLIGAPLLLGAVAGMVLGAALIAFAARDRRVGGDLAVAVTITALTGAGALLALAPATPAGLQERLFGDLLGVRPVDVAVAAALAAGGLATLAAAHRPLSLAAFDPAAARTLGTHPERADLLLLLLLALAVVAAVGGLGTLLVVAFLLAPAATALRFTARLGPALAAAAALAVATGVAGLYVTYYLKLAAGASVALVAVAVFASSLLARAAGPPPSGAGGPVEALGAAR